MELAKQFTDFYYQTFDTNRPGLKNLYRDNSMLTWEGTQVLGAANIGNKLEGGVAVAALWVTQILLFQNLPFQRIVHKVNTVDAQPSSAAGNALMVIVTGQLLIDDEKNPHHFTQAFQLVAEGQAYFVFNDVFRLNYG